MTLAQFQNVFAYLDDDTRFGGTKAVFVTMENNTSNQALKATVLSPRLSAAVRHEEDEE